MSTHTTVMLTLAAYFIFSAAADAMSPPTQEQARGWYGFLFRFTQRLAANANRLAEARFGSLVEQPSGATLSATHAEVDSFSVTK